MAEQSQAPQDPAGDLMEMQQSLVQLAQGLEGTMPPEALQHLQNSASEFGQFLQASGLASGGESGGMSSEQAQGKPGAMPEGQPMRPGAKLA